MFNFIVVIENDYVIILEITLHCLTFKLNT